MGGEIQIRTSYNISHHVTTTKQVSVQVVIITQQVSEQWL